MKLGRWEIVTQNVRDVPADVIRIKQVHDNAIVWAPEAHGHLLLADGIAASSDFALPFMITTADCLPLVLLSDDVACALHVSRKTLVGGLLDNVPQFIQPDTIRQVWIGPHVCADHFVFEYWGPEIVAFQQKFPTACETGSDGVHLSTLTATLSYLNAWGVMDQAIIQDGRCTYEKADLPSYRRTGTLSDSLATVIKVSENI